MRLTGLGFERQRMLQACILPRWHLEWDVTISKKTFLNLIDHFAFH